MAICLINYKRILKYLTITIYILTYIVKIQTVKLGH